jgi:hypothetical protein
MLPRPFPLAAGNRRHRNRPVKPLPPSLTMARDFEWEESKARGAVCETRDSDEECHIGTLCYLCCRF